MLTAPPPPIEQLYVYSPYASYTFYTNSYLQGHSAAIPQADYDFFAAKATEVIKQYIGNKTIENENMANVKMCCCEVAEIMCVTEKNNKSGITSERVGEVSISYENAEANGQAMSNKIRRSVYTWLADTGLLFTGV